MKSKELTNQGAGKRRGFPVKAYREPCVLWKANLRIGDRKDWFLYRAGEEFEAAVTAETLLQQSTAATMVGAVIIGIERQARLWN